MPPSLYSVIIAFSGTQKQFLPSGMPISSPIAVTKNTVMEQYMLRQQSSIRLSQMGWEKKIKKSGRPIKNRRHRI